MARLGVKREQHRVEPGLHTMGNPKKDSPVFVSANYTLSFDALRSALKSIDCYILVLDTKGVNVWCAAGKGTFGTNEIVHRIESVGLKDVVNHRTLIVPQLGATGVDARQVRERSGFKVEFGPVRAADLPEYLKTHRATQEMRRMRFTLYDRIVLIPVEMKNFLMPLLIASVILALVGSYTASAAVIAATFSGLVLFPILLPWIPTTDFSTKGFLIGGLATVPFALDSFYSMTNENLWLRFGWILAYMLVMPQISAFLALNFTGSTTFASVTGVKREIFKYIHNGMDVRNWHHIDNCIIINENIRRNLICSIHMFKHPGIRSGIVHQLRYVQHSMPTQGIQSGWKESPTRKSKSMYGMRSMPAQLPYKSNKSG